MNFNPKERVFDSLVEYMNFPDVGPKLKCRKDARNVSLNEMRQVD